MKTFLHIPSPVRTHKTPGRIGFIAFGVLLFLGVIGTWQFITKSIPEAQAAGTIYYVDSSITDTNVGSATPDCTNDYGFVDDVVVTASPL